MNFFLLLCSLLAACAFAETSDRDEAQYNKEFYTACATGDLQLLQKFLDEDPGLATTPTPDGETCLHLTSISKSVEIVKLMIDLGSDVNHRVTHSRGLRMTPLSWHVYAGSYETVKLLLDNGAEVNMVFDLDETRKQVTVRDISSQLAKSKDDNEEPDPSDVFVKTHELLISRGAKIYSELNNQL